MLNNFVDLSNPSNQNPAGGGYQMATRFTKIKFARFDGMNLEGWLGELFSGTSPLLRIVIRWRNLAGIEYIEVIKGRFRKRVYDPMADMKGLVQAGSLQDYLEEFDMLPHKWTGS
ncbi:conserved hypothetical protein [Ricinus communis]|uniref:Retrotransposon gag domain-containing protein n=1 Tax=Ricinus communis TaxID=3988 RepID=B9SBY8_RICCO|nr:conserved hypothetical protein [Ricinus communis]